VIIYGPQFSYDVFKATESILSTYSSKYIYLHICRSYQYVYIQMRIKYQHHIFPLAATDRQTTGGIPNKTDKQELQPTHPPLIHCRSSPQLRQVITTKHHKGKPWTHGKSANFIIYVKMRGYINRCSGCCALKPEGTDTSFRATPGQPYVLPRAIIPRFTLRAPHHLPNPTKPVYSRSVFLGSTLQKFFLLPPLWRLYIFILF
jgi:hypothetical protein